MIKLVIFDLDGTLINSLDDLADCANYALRELNYPEHPTEAYRYFVGDGMVKLMERILPEEERNLLNINKLLNIFLPYYNIHKEDKTQPYPNIAELLLQLQKRGIAIAVASNKAHQFMGDIMQGYFPNITFASIYGARPNILPKPDAQIVYDILTDTQISAEETLYVGDTNTDIRTAQNGNLKSVGVLWGYRERAELEQAGAHYIIKNPLEILSLIERL